MEAKDIANLVVGSLTLIAAIAVAVIYFFQLKAMQDATKAQNLAGLIMYLQSPEVRAARHFVFTQLKNKPYTAWKDDPKSRENAATALAAYGVAGVMTQIGRVECDPIVKNWGPSIRLICETCEDFVKAQQDINGPQYWKALEWLNAQVAKTLPPAKKDGSQSAAVN